MYKDAEEKTAGVYAEAEDETVDATEKAGEAERVFERVLWAGASSTSISISSMVILFFRN